MNFSDIPRNIIFIVTGGLFAVGITTPVVIWRFKKQRRQSINLQSREIRERLKSDIVLNAIQDGVLIVDTDGMIQVFNPSAGKLLGWKATDAIGLDYKLVLKLVDQQGKPVDEETSPLHKVFSGKKPLREDRLLAQSHEGKNLALSLSVSPLLDSEGNVSAVVVIFRDISQEKGEQARRAEFISTASHEMRTPVAAIEGYLALALNENVSRVDAKAREYLTKAHASTQHLGKLFQDLLTSAKAEDGRLTSHPSVIEMGKFTEQLTEDLRFSAEKKDLAVEYIVGSPQATIDASTPHAKVIRPLYYAYVDPDRMREVITNIFDNAVKYTESGRISIGITGDNNVVQIRVSDSGPGIPAEDIPHLFNKFYRVDNSATRTAGGTGLGLFICRKIVELYNGRIWVESTVGQGSTFYVNIPRLTAQKAAQLKASESNRYGLNSLTTNGNKLQI